MNQTHEEHTSEATAALLDKNSPGTSADYSKPSKPKEEDANEQKAAAPNAAAADSPPSPGTFKRLVAYSKRYLGFVLFSNGLMVAETAAGIMVPWLIGQIIDTIIRKESFDALSLQFILTVGAQAVCLFFKQILTTTVEERVIRDVRSDLFRSIIWKDVEFFDTRKTGELISRLSSDTATVKTSASSSLWNMIRAILQVIGYLVMLFTISWKLALILLGAIPIFGGATMIFTKVTSKLSKQYQDDLAAGTVVAEEAISSARVVRAFGCEKKESDAFDAKNSLTYNTGFKVGMANAIFSSSLNFVLWGTILIVLVFGGQFVRDDEMTAGDLSAFMMYTVIMAINSAGITVFLGQIINSLAACSRIFEIMDTNTKIMEPSPTAIATIPEFKGEIALKNVVFHYPTKTEVNVLKNISLIVSPGEVIAIVGSSGSGKSSIVNIIERFYDVIEGQITFDNYNIKDLDIGYVHRSIGYVAQEPTLFSGTIEENIAYGVPSYTKEQLDHATKLAHAYDFIHKKDQFPDGYATVVGEKGVKLSGGQKQRIAIARALIKRPKILIFDEATSALDSESEWQVQQAIEGIMQQMETTMIIIAHRLSTIINCKRILVLQNGEIVEEGNHEALVAKQGIYSNLMEKQLQGLKV